MFNRNFNLLIIGGAACVIFFAFHSAFQDKGNATTHSSTHVNSHVVVSRSLLDRPLLNAVEHKNMEGINNALSLNGIYVNETDSSGRNAMHMIAKRGHYQYPPAEIPLLLIQRGIDLNAKDCDGNTALVISLLSGWQKIAMLLLDHGADKTCVTVDVKNRITCPDCKRVVKQYGL